MKGRRNQVNPRKCRPHVDRRHREHRAAIDGKAEGDRHISIPAHEQVTPALGKSAFDEPDPRNRSLSIAHSGQEARWKRIPFGW